MPALYTHYKFGNDVLNNLNTDITNKINNELNYYFMFNQGWDNLYYHFKWNYYKKFGTYAHKNNVDKFFYNLITYIKENNLEEEHQITNMIYGFINHYILDTLLHPYINYQVKNLKIAHSKIEFILDNMLYQKEHHYKWKGNFFKTLIPKLKFSNNLSKTIEYTFFKTYNKNNMGKIFNTSHNNGYYLYRYIIFDKNGIKTKIYKLLDYIIPFKKLKFHECTYCLKDYNEYIFNYNKIIWHHPKNKLEEYNYSLEELYNYSLNIAIKLNTIIYNILYTNEDIDKLISLIKLINIKNIQELLKK